MQLGRNETIRYHEALYSEESALNQSWLSRPSPMVMRAVSMLPLKERLRVLDLGCGIGRHALPIAERIQSPSTIVAVDLLKTAIDRLSTEGRKRGVSDRLELVVSDIEAFSFEAKTYDLVICCSVLEHASSEASFARILGAVAKATRPGGMNAMVVGVEKREFLCSGADRPALVEFNLSRIAALSHLQVTYAGWDILEQDEGNFIASETRDGQKYDLKTHCIRLLARRGA